MNKKRLAFIISLTVLVIIVLALFIGHTIRSVNRRVTQYCFEDLQRASIHLARDLYDNVQADRTILTAMAAIIGGEKGLTEEEQCSVMNSYSNPMSYLSYVSLLRPDGTMLKSDGSVRFAPDILDFKTEAQKAPYISDKITSPADPNKRVIRNAVPVIRDGETVYILYGVIRLDELAEKYKTDIYDGHAFVYLVDGISGDFMMDTWHNTYGNINDFTRRKMLSGYSFDEAVDNMRQGVAGNLGFVSNTTGNVLYMHYEPVGINNWTVAVTVEEVYAIAEPDAVSNSLYRMAAVIGVTILLYMTFLLIFLFRAYWQMRRMGMEDQITGLLNRNSFEKYAKENQQRVFNSITCVYVDGNGLHELNNEFGHAAGDAMLRSVADALKAEFAGCDVYRVGGDEFVALCENCDRQTCAERMQRVSDQLEEQGYSVSAGIVCRTNEAGIDRVTAEADSQALESKNAYYTTHDRRGRR